MALQNYVSKISKPDYQNRQEPKYSVKPCAVNMLFTFQNCYVQTDRK